VYFPLHLILAAMKISFSSGIFPLLKNTDLILALSDERSLVVYLHKGISYITNTLVLLEKLKLRVSSLSNMIRSKVNIRLFTCLNITQ
jgi:hypothetical protein